MPRKKLPQTVEECNAELERTQKLLQQYENRNKMLNRKLSVEKRKERNHRIFLFGGFMESIVPELKTMTEDEGKDFLSKCDNFVVPGIGTIHGAFCNNQPSATCVEVMPRVRPKACSVFTMRISARIASGWKRGKV